MLGKITTPISQIDAGPLVDFGGHPTGGLTLLVCSPSFVQLGVDITVKITVLKINYKSHILVIVYLQIADAKQKKFMIGQLEGFQGEKGCGQLKTCYALVRSVKKRLRVGEND